MTSDLDQVDVDLAEARDRLRSCIFECGYSLHALAAAMGKGDSYTSYIVHVLNGEKPLSYGFIVRLPADVRAEFHSRSAETLGRVVIAPAPGKDAAKQLLQGVLGMLQDGTLTSVDEVRAIAGGRPAKTRTLLRVR